MMPVSNTEKELIKWKVTIKAWESEFTKSNQRKPGKEDIQLASSEIKDAYKKYWSLKRDTEATNGKNDDVWSEKLNKSNNSKLKTQRSDAIFKKFCNKIRERSSDANLEINTKEFLPREKLKSQSAIPKITASTLPSTASTLQVFNEQVKSDVSFNACNDEDEVEIIKPVRNIMKFNNTCKIVKSVSVLSSSSGLKKHKSSMHFETNLDNEWLERCYSDQFNISDSNKIYSNDEKLSKSSVPTSQSDTSLNNESRILDMVESFSSSDNLENKSTFSNLTGKHIEIDSVNDKSKEQKANIDTISESHPENSKEINTEHLTVLSQKNQTDSLPVLKSEIKGICSDSKRSLTRNLASTSKSSNHLKRKILSGTLNENYVKVNIKKKKFSRGHRSVNIRKLKWQKWKQLKKYGNNDAPSTSTGCFKCGQPGHWARNCKVLPKSSENTEDCMENIEDAPLPTLKEAAELAKKSKFNMQNMKIPETSKTSGIISDEISVMQQVAQEDFNFDEVDLTERVVRPVYKLKADGHLIDTPSEVFDSLKELGYSEFRNGQETAIMRILSGLSTLVVLPTGSGKSLCYQLPAYIYAKKFKSITLVISPLVSLMEDQITGLASCLHAICLHSGMTDTQKKASLQDLSDGKAQILLVSPEAVIGGFGCGAGMLPSNMPPISFACIDEAHCLSQWSHNFRPSYLQLYKVLTQHFNVKCILGLTATANKSTAQEIISHLGFKSIEESVIGSTGIPSNLHISVSKDKDKDRALIQLLTGDRFSHCDSIIIYCIRRDETERISALIRTCLQDHISDKPPTKKSKSKSKKRNFKWTAEAYHAGLAPPRRRSIQKQFMTGKLRVIVATIAFGMGLDKRDVRAVIHFNMPKSFESYVQEIGRAGRDGLDSHCHLFLDNEGKDMQELQRFIYANSTDRYVIRKLLRKVFVPNQCLMLQEKLNLASSDEEILNDTQISCSKHEIAFSINDTVQELDLKEENISTLLCYLELHPKKWIEVLSLTYGTCTIRCYGGPKQLRALALKSPPVAAAFALDARRNKKLENISTYEFAVVEVASIMGWNPSAVKRALKNLEWNDHKQKTGVIVEFSNLSFHLKAPCNLSSDELDDVLDFLYQKVIKSENDEIRNLKALHSIFSKYSQSHYWSCCDEAPVSCSEGIKEAINLYFDETEYQNADMDTIDRTDGEAEIDEQDIRSQIRDIIYTNNDQNFNGRAIARIFHGIGSPCYPAEVWGRVRKFWRCLLHINFNILVKLGNEELKKAK